MEEQELTIVSYGIGDDYLKDWGIKEALREVFQNFIDYGNYNVNTDFEEGKNKFSMAVDNDYVAESLEFLQIGKSIKQNQNSIGKHGEGLKMAFLIFLRNNIEVELRTGNFLIIPMWIEQEYIGKTLSISITKLEDVYEGFKITTIADISLLDLYTTFVSDMITEKDVIYTDSYHGSIVNKPAGNLYSGSLFVTHLKNLKKSYNLPPSVLSLDRDRRIPSAFEVSYHTSKINESQLREETETAKIDFVDQDYDDYKYNGYVPNSILQTIKPKEILGKVEFVAEVTNADNEKEEIIIKNEKIKDYLKSQSVFSIAINKIKSFILSKFGVTELIVNFRKKYCHNDDIRQEFDEIIARLGIKIQQDDGNPD